MSIERYKKKPIAVEAIQWDGTPDGATTIIQWALDNGGTIRFHEFDEHAEGGPQVATLSINTLEGTMTAYERYWIIRGVKGEFYGCDPAVFDASYEAAEHAPESLVDRVRALIERNEYDPAPLSYGYLNERDDGTYTFDGTIDPVALADWIDQATRPQDRPTVVCVECPAFNEEN